jgi:peptidoglycan/LPS O-acetylase OafA/YrhL
MDPSTYRNQSLDVLRALAVIAVVGHHLDYYPIWTKAGWVGVDLFFVLSGFLISGLLFQEYKASGKIEVRRFLLRRGLKIWPSYYLLLIGVTCLYFFNKSAMSKGQLLSNLFVIQNYFPGHPNYLILSHTWTLALEEHFYLFLPLLLVFLIAIRKESPFSVIPPLSVLIAVVCLCFRFTLLPHELAWATHMRADGLFGGVTLGYLHHFKPFWFAKLTGNYALLMTALLISPAFLFEQPDRRIQRFGLTSIALGFIFLVAWAVVRSPRSRAMQITLGGFARVGVYSYSIYLWHTVIADGFLFHPPSSFAKFWLYMISSITGGIAMAHLVEIPYLRLRDRMFPTGRQETQ